MAVTDAMGLDLFNYLDDRPQFIVPFEDQPFSRTYPGVLVQRKFAPMLARKLTGGCLY